MGQGKRYNLPTMFRLIFWLFVLFLALSYFGISMEQIINSPAGQQNLAYVQSLMVLAYHWFLMQVQ